MPFLIVNLPIGLRGVSKAPRTLFRSQHPMFLYSSPGSPSVSYQHRHNSSVAAALRTPQLTHIDDSGRPAMVDVSAKEPTKRTATARGRIWLPKVAYELITEPAQPDAENKHATSTSANSSSSALETAKRKARAKGDVLTVAQLAAIMGCKRTSELVPLCHPLQISHISVKLYPEMRQPVPEPAPRACAGRSDDDVNRTRPEATEFGGRSSPYSVLCVASVTCEGKTGVEMEALTAVSVGLLTVWDMLKAVAGKEMIIGDVAVVEKHGGKSGDFVRESV